jgi:hypothetical protein
MFVHYYYIGAHELLKSFYYYFNFIKFDENHFKNKILII